MAFNAASAWGTCGRMFIEIIRRRTDNQNSDISASDVLLMPDVLIYGDRSEGHRDGREISWQALPPLAILTWIFSSLTNNLQLKTYNRANQASAR